jgi:CheY-like chemotaxis protein
LTLAKNLVEMHGGRIEAHSSGPGQGSEFVVCLPIVVCEVEPQPAAAGGDQGDPGQQRRILVVDDNADAAQSLATLLKLRGHEVQVALGGREALAAARAAPPELVFLDIGMPEIDGYEVARQLRAELNGDTMGLIAVTGWGTEQDRRRSKEAGFDFHLTKPVGLAAVEQVMEKLAATTV